MLFTPVIYEKKAGRFTFGAEVKASAHPVLDKDILREFWNGFCSHASKIEFSAADSLTFTIGDATAVDCGDYAYTINVTESGIALTAADEVSLVNGYTTLLDMIETIDGDEGHELFAVDCCVICDRPAMKNRMVHFCVFPETELDQLRRFVRMCGALKFSHIVIEFWGMLKYDCLAELSWPFGFTKDQVRPIIKEANDLGMEVIPMFNHFGHASAGRLIQGKHVVLDQNPRLQPLFNRDGWVWNTESPRVRELLAKVRRELIDLCGRGEYFHLGFDEIYGSETSSENMKKFIDYVGEITEELAAEGRRPIVWADMLLLDKGYPVVGKYECNCKNEATERLFIENLDRRAVLADWQYWVKSYPVETTIFLQKQGFDTLCCPWDLSMDNINVCVNTVKDTKAYGVMHTTWDTLSRGMYLVTKVAVDCWCAEAKNVGTARFYRVETAALLRRVMSVNGEYLKAGWSREQIGNYVGDNI